MAILKTYSSLFAYLFACMFVVFVAGCGGGSGDQTGTGTEAPIPFAVTYDELTAIPGPMAAVRVGEVATLDGSGSSITSNEPLSYSWSFSYKPDTSITELQGATTATPSFVADVRGIYMLQLLVSAEGVTSQRAIAIVVVTNENESLIGPFLGHQGVSSNCVGCHNGVNLNSTGKLLPHKVPNHVASSNMCQACHTPQGLNIIPFVDHQEVFGNCSECHNGVVAIGKSEFHTPTNTECSDCHNTTSFLELAPDGSFDHSTIVRACSGCHNGTVAIGKTPTSADTPPGNHPDTNSECGNCHTTASFLNAYPDHTATVVTDFRCDSCHGVSTTDLPRDPPVGHPLTSVDCETCHSIVSFKMPGGIFNHSLLDPTVQSCESCHNDNNSINARGKASAVPTHTITTADCGSCHSVGSFTPAFADHTGIVDNCGLSCHVADGTGTASGMPLATPFYAHMATTEDCSVCHTPGTFSTGTFNHTGPSFVGRCDSCHNNVTGVGKLPNHIPTDPLLDCGGACHVTSSFADITFDHASTDTSNCLACHDGSISKGKPLGHVATDLNCSSCHTTTFATFAGTFDHNPAVVNGDCASCHNSGIALPKKVNHIPAQAECSQCHNNTNTGGFTSSTFFANVHPGITSGCEGCHSGQFSTNSTNLYGKPGSHLPTGQDCDVCHTNITFAASIFDHSGITGNCASCHDGNHVVPAGALGKTPTHPVTTADCGVCHGIGANFKDGIFDHTGIVANCAQCHGDGATGAVTKKNLGHLPTTQDCSFCHVPGTFKPAVFDHSGIVNNCTSCHGDASTAAVTKKNIDHVSTASDCSVCHNTTAFAGATFDHTGIIDNCASCHDGATARGKTPPPNHVPTTQDCSVCHQTTGFIPGTFAHTGIVDNCRSCHDGAFAVGKTDTHVLTNQDCGICHTTSLPLTFTGAVFDHTGIVDNCVSCHDGGTAIGMDAKTNPGHIPTALDCYFCHTTATFTGGTWVHDASTVNNCDSCHVDGGAAKIFQPTNGHLNTSVQCDVCHSTNGWAPSIFSHTSANYPGDHRRDPGCSGCHGNTVDNTLPYPHLQYAPPQRNAVYCAACHAGDFERKGDHIGGENGTVEQNKNCAGSGCHRVTDSEF